MKDSASLLELRALGLMVKGEALGLLSEQTWKSNED